MPLHFQLPPTKNLALLACAGVVCAGWVGLGEREGWRAQRRRAVGRAACAGGRAAVRGRGALARPARRCARGRPSMQTPTDGGIGPATPRYSRLPPRARARRGRGRGASGWPPARSARSAARPGCRGCGFGGLTRPPLGPAASARARAHGGAEACAGSGGARAGCNGVVLVIITVISYSHCKRCAGRQDH